MNEQPPPHLSLERLRLQPLAQEHADALHEIFADPIAMEFWSTPPHQDPKETRNMIEKLRGGQEIAWALVRSTDGLGIGLVYYLNDTNAPGLGYILSRSHWGRGLMSEAVRGVLGWGFETRGLDRVELWIDSNNAPSISLAERVGFRQRAQFIQRFPHRAHAHRNLVYGLRSDEWRKGGAPRPRQRIEAFDVVPILSVPSVRDTVEFYCRKLGFSVEFLYGDPPMHAGVSLADWTMTGARIQFSHSQEPLCPSGIALYVSVDESIETYFSQCTRSGVQFVSGLQEMPWGAREFAVRDGNGYVIRFATAG